MSNVLAVYLHDHLAGADLAIDLLDRIAEQQKGSSLGRFAERLLREVTEDRDELRKIAEKIGSGFSVLKELMGWVSGKAARVKLGRGGPEEFSTFEAVEFLALGVLGKRGLWKALLVAAAREERLRGWDFERLIARAEAQYSGLEEQRLALASKVLKGK